MTTGNPDMWDCYAVEVDPDNPARYLFDGEWQEMIQIEETFQVRDGEPVTQVLEYTRHNDVLSPVVARRGGKAYVVSTSQMHDAGLLDNEIWQMNQASSVFDLRDAMASLGMFPQNIIAGDSSGNIWYLRAGKTPIRPEGYDWSQPVPGNSSDTAWRGYYALDDMVQVLNPPQNFLQRFTMADATAHAFDETWITTEYWLMALRYALEQFPQWLEENSGEAGDLVRRLLGFDGVASADSMAALNFYYWRAGMYAVLSRPEFEYLQTLPWSKDDFSPEFAAAILEQAGHAAAVMVEQLGSTDVTMGAVFRVGRGERSWPLGGETIDTPEIPSCVADLSPLCERTMRAFASGAADEQGQRRAYRGSQSMRLVELTDPVRSWTLHVYGQSDDPASPHYDDQARLLSEGRFKPTYFNRDNLEGHIESTTILELGAGAGK
jgi:acyl-homoserine lactone acylase PvdQ